MKNSRVSPKLRDVMQRIITKNNTESVRRTGKTFIGHHLDRVFQQVHRRES